MNPAPRINHIYPDVVGVNTNLNKFPYMNSAGRLYMQGNMTPKSVVVSGASETLINTGFEKQYGDVARSIVAPANMTVEEIFYVKSSRGDGMLTDGWKEIYIIFKNDDKNYYDLLVLPRFNTQNTYVGFEYKYDKNIMRKLHSDDPSGIVFAKGDVFATSPRISPGGAWMPGTETIVAEMSAHGTEEDGIIMTDRYANEKLACMFKHERGFEWDESEWVPLNLYGTIDDPRPFGEPGQPIREDGIVMGFRRRNGCNPLVGLTKKGLMNPDFVFDKLFYAPPSSVLMDVEIFGEKIKDRSHNRSSSQIPQQHNNALREYEDAQNNFHNDVITWYERAISKNGGVEPETSYQLDRFIRNAYGLNSRRNGDLNTLGYSYKGIKHRDWKVRILLKERVVGRVKFKLAGFNGDKGIAVKIIPWQEAPHYEDGTYADLIVNNTPAFRRQIMGMLNEATINFINLQLHKELKVMVKEGNYEHAWKKLSDFYRLGFPEFYQIVECTFPHIEDKYEHLDYVVKHVISVQHRSDSELFGINIVRNLRTVFKYQPQRVWFTNEFGQEVQSHNPVMLTSLYFMLLDKFGADDSSQSFPKANPFGLPKANSPADKYTNWYIDKGNRNIGEAETRWENSQSGAKENLRQLALASSEVVRNNAIKRIIRADDPFDIDQIVKDEELSTNRAVIMGAELLSDAGYVLRHELPEDL